MPILKRTQPREKLGITECTWYLWEQDFPPPGHGFFGVMMSDGEEMAALYDSRGVWWSLRMERIVPMFWRDSSRPHH